MDPLSDVLSLLNVSSVLSSRFEAEGRWALRFPPYRHLKFGSVLEGTRWVWIEGVTEPVRLDSGDFFLLSSGTPYCFASDLNVEPCDGQSVFAEHTGPDGIVRYGHGGERTVGIGGRFTLDDDMSDILLNFLPPLIHVRSDSPQARALRPALELISFETEMVRAGASAVAGSLANIVLVSILRTFLVSDLRPPGWLGALSDVKIGRALGLMHQDIAHRWKVEDLALAVGMSRTAFAERFKSLVGSAPLDYLIRWRMRVARNALKADKESLSSVATKIGYASETAFSLAFKRTFGDSPGRYRSEAKKQLGSAFGHI